MSKNIMMANVTEETVALAQQLWALYVEAIGFKGYEQFDDMDERKEAWIQVAQFVEASKEATEYIFNDSNSRCPNCHKIMDEPDHR